MLEYSISRTPYIVNKNTENSVNSTQSQIENSKDQSNLWDEIGFHKPIAGFWFNITYGLLGIFASMLLMGYLMNIFYPFPESMGYRDVPSNMFGFIFTLFDIATGAVMSRFIPEVNIKNPERMLHLIQYFIWYQMISGLVQTTLVSVYALFYANKTNVAYTVWLMLILSLTQFPGWLGVFSNLLDALQHYHKAQTSRFLASTIVDRIFGLGFVFLGRLYGRANPEIGEILGIAIGASVGGYIASFTAMIISSYFFSQVMSSYGVRLVDCFRIQFTWQEVKEPLVYAIKTSVPSIIGGFLGLINFYLWITYLPQYTTITVLSGIGGSIADSMNWFGVPTITSLVAESYMNNKKKLTQYYFGQIFRFYTLLNGFFAPFYIITYFELPRAWMAFGMVNYLGSIFFVLPRLFKTMVTRYTGLPGQVIYGGGRANFQMITGIIYNVLGTGFLYLYLAVWQLPVRFGLVMVGVVWELYLIPLDLIFGLISYIYVHKTMIKVRIPWAQIIVGFFLPAIITLGFLIAVKFFVFESLYKLYGFVIAFIPTIFCFLIALFYVYFPLTAIFGGWDQTNLSEFKKVAYMSGPSKFIVVPIYHVVRWICSWSPLFGRFEMPIEGVIQEAQELLQIKASNREKFKEKLQQG